MLNEYDHVTDEEIDDIYGEHEKRAHAPQITPIAPAGAQPIGHLNGLPLYPIGLAQAPAPADNFLTRKYGPLPVWGWAALAVAGVGTGGYLLWQSQKKVVKNDSEDDESAPAAEADDEPNARGAWHPSRGAFAGQLNRYFARKGMTNKVHIYDDADRAVAAKLKHVSPLINIKCETSFKPDKDLERLCKRDGLKVETHADGTIGLYPAENTKRGREWEKYIDLLRDDGQTV